MTGADSLGDVSGMAGDQLDRRVGLVGEVLAQKLDREHDPDDAVAGGNRIELRVGEIARRGSERMDPGMRGDERPGLGPRDIPEAGLVEVAEVDQDSQFGAAPDQRMAGRG